MWVCDYIFDVITGKLLFIFCGEDIDQRQFVSILFFPTKEGAEEAISLITQWASQGCFSYKFAASINKAIRKLLGSGFTDSQA